MEDWFKGYSQTEREYLKRVIRKLYQIKKAEIDKSIQKNKAMTLSNMFMKNVILPKFFREDVETLKDLVLYSEWIINHWRQVSELVGKESTALLYHDEETIRKINLLKSKIRKLEGKEIVPEKLNEKYLKMIQSGKTPDKIRIEKLNKETVDNALKFVEEIERAV